MNWDNIRIFLAVARTGSISSAGRELGINHSTVLRRIQALEDELQVRLFHRESRGYTLTKLGNRIMDSALMMDQDATALKRQILSTDEEPAGKLHIAMPPGTCLNLAPQIQAFQMQYPDIELYLDSQPSLHNLDKMEADIAIRLTQQPPEHCLSLHLFDMPFRLYGSQQYLSTFAQMPQLSELSWICYDLPNQSTAMEDWLTQQDPNTRIVARVNTLALATQLVDHHMGVSFLPVHRACENEQLVEITSLDFKFDFPVYLLAHRDLIYQSRVNRFFEFAKEHIRQCQ